MNEKTIQIIINHNHIANKKKLTKIKNFLNP